jgi:hypothetical protein
MENGKHRDTNADTGRQRSEPEEGEHARQLEGSTGRQESWHRNDLKEVANSHCCPTY